MHHLNKGSSSIGLLFMLFLIFAFSLALAGGGSNFSANQTQYPNSNSTTGGSTTGGTSSGGSGTGGTIGNTTNGIGSSTGGTTNNNNGYGTTGSGQIIVTTTLAPGLKNLQLRTFTIITLTPAPTSPPPQPSLATELYDCTVVKETTKSDSQVLRAYAPQIAGPTDSLKVWFTDEKTPQLGVSKITYHGPTGNIVKTLPISEMKTGGPESANPVLTGFGYADEPDVHWRGTDTLGRPIFPAIFLTDITSDPNSNAGDWEVAGDNAKPYPPDAIFGTWKVTEKIFDSAWNPTIQVGQNADTNNHWDLGPGSDPVPASAGSSEEFGTEARWEVSKLNLQPGHTYRVEFMVHDGDATQVGGDVDQACGSIRIP
jgi:hypothetical protein